MSDATPPKSRPSAPAQSSPQALQSAAPSPLTAPVTPAKHADMGIPDGWADPINSVELGGGSSDAHSHKVQGDSSSAAVQEDDGAVCPMCGGIHGPESFLIEDDDQGDEVPPPNYYFDKMEFFKREFEETGDKAAYDRALHKWYLRAWDMFGMNEDRARNVFHLPERFIGANRSKRYSELKDMISEGNAEVPNHGSDDDDEGDMMNMPPSYVAPSHRPKDIQNILSGTREATQDEVELLSQHRSELEVKIKEDLTHQQHDAEAAAKGPSLGELEELAGAVPIALGVVVVEPARLDDLLSDEPGVSYGSGPLPDEPASTPRRESRPDASRRVSFADEPTVIDDPFHSTLQYFKGFKGTGVDDSPRGRTKGKENSPYKPRRKASLPEEIAELKREASASSDEDLSDLEKYREYDLAPLDPVMEADSAGDLIAGDLIMAKSSPSVNKQQNFVKGDIGDMEDDAKGSKGHAAKQSLNAMSEATKPEQHKTPPTTPAKTAMYELSIPGSDNKYNLKIETNASPDKIAEHMRETATQLEAKEEDIEEAVNSFLEEPESFIVVDNNSSSDAAQNGGTLVNDDDEHPVFIKVISMVPTTMFWALVHPVAYYSNKLYEAVLEKLGGMTL